MPVVFSPGEPETRPLDPDAIVYTTPQKVADLLGIGPSEAVLASANAVSDGVFVTGGDFRNIGFSANDTILIYSDLDPKGVELNITSTTSGGASGVKLVTDTSFTHTNFTTAANTYVENQASFTNGKTRGMTKAIVETRIKEVQDRIDNITHNAWRPYLVSAEYLNFDTYKPYRRRYFTDYVGTTPLLFRNVQQMLRIEMWQGEDYREICGAEARLEIKDTLTTSEAIHIGLEGGFKADMGAALSNGTSSFDIRFDRVYAAQSLADLVNKEDRVSKAAINFQDKDGNTFTMAGSTSNVSLHNEIFASANADYGNGKVKLTSMRQTKGGESVSIASTNLDDITITQTTSVSTTSTSVVGTTVNVASTEGFADGGVLMVGDGTGTNVETLLYQSKTATSFLNCSNLNGAALTTLNTGGTTVFQRLFKLDLQAGSSSGDQARLRDWWIDSEMGIIYFNNSYPFFEHNSVKVSYIYGERYLEKAIEEAATKMVAADLLLSDDRSVLIPEGSQNVDLGSKIQLFRKEAEELLTRYKEVVVFS
jgi:hypothetical protein